MWRRQAVASLTAILVAGLAVVPGVGAVSPARAATPIDWPTYRGDASRSGVSPGSGPAHDPTQLWKVTTTGNIASEPAVVDGIVYIGSDDGILHALDAVTGAERWHYTGEAAMSSSPAVADGTVFVGSGNGMLYALDAVTGSERWRFAGARADTGPAVVDGVVYSGSDDGNLYAIDATTGARIWAAALGDDASRSPAVADGLVVIGSADSAIHAVDAATGKERWRFQTDGGVISTPVVVNGVVFDCAFEGDANRMYALDAMTGAELWRFSTKTGDSVWPPIVNGADLYTGGSDGNLYALDAMTGAERWRFQTGGEINASPTLAGGIIYLVNQASQMYAVDAATGHEVWQLPIDAGSEKGPSIADGVAYFGTSAGSVYAIGAGTPGGQPSGSAPGGQASVAPAAPTGIPAAGLRPAQLNVKSLFDSAQGTFTAQGPVCGSGTTTDVVQITDTGVRAFFDDQKTFDCADGSGTFTLHAIVTVKPCQPLDDGWWVVEGGTGRYAHLRGGGADVGSYFVGAGSPGDSCNADGVADVFTGFMTQ